MRYLIVLITVFQFPGLWAQDREVEVMEFAEYLAYVKQYHPVVRQAQLHLEKGEAELLRARGAFDPKLEVDYAQKQFKGTEYYDILNSTFKIPTWYGLEFKAGFEQNEGIYLNPERTVPPEGLFSAGVSVSAAQGLLLDKRRAALRQAKALAKQSLAERQLLVNEVLYEASVAYLQWATLYLELQIYENFLQNAQQRFVGVSKSAGAGQVAAIDTVEAEIVLQDRELQLEQTKVKLLKQQLEVSNFLWLKDHIPVELEAHIIPNIEVLEEVNLPQQVLEQISIENHPKLIALKYKIEALEVERKLKMNNLLPKVDLNYNFITPEPEVIGGFDTSNYKAGLSFSFPLFLRKERGELRLSELKIEDASLEVEISERRLENKIESLLQELESYKRQIVLIYEMVENYKKLLAAEERKFSFGESSLFLINSRENKLIEAKLKQNELLAKFLLSKAQFYQSLGLPPEFGNSQIVPE